MIKQMTTPLIIAGFAGIGKTYAGNKYKNVIDLESSPFHYDYSNISPDEYEVKKGDPNRKVNPEFPDNYIKEIKNSIGKYDIIFIWLQINNGFLDLCEKNGIDYQICIPSKKAFKSYKQRYLSRGNTDNWLSKIDNYYEKCREFVKTNNHKLIVLNEGETIESWLIKKGYKLIT